MESTKRRWWCFGALATMMVTGLILYWLSAFHPVISERLFSLDANLSPYCIWTTPRKLAIVMTSSTPPVKAVYFQASSRRWLKSTSAEPEDTWREVERIQLQQQPLRVEGGGGTPSGQRQVVNIEGRDFPAGSGIFVAMAISEDERYTAFIVEETHSFPGSAQLGRLLPGLERGRNTDLDLWVSDGNLHYPHFVGRVISGVRADEMIPLSSLQWTPDGRRISFIYGDGLYVTRAVVP